MKQEFVRNPYNYDSDKLSQDTGLACKDKSRTEQEHLQETDINFIADRFMRTGAAPQVLNMPTYGDFRGTFDFQSSMNLIKQAKDEFMSLPAKVRTRFANDPQNLLEFLNDPENREEAIKLGFVNKPDTIPAPPTTEVSDGTSTTGSTQAAPQKPQGARGAKADAAATETAKKP